MLRGSQDPAELVDGGADVAHMLRDLSRQDLVHGGDDLVVAAGAQDPVHLRHFPKNLVLIPLGQAARHQDLAHVPLGL